MMCFLMLAAPLLQADESQFTAVDYLTPPSGEVIEVGGMDFNAAGDLFVSTRRGQVWLIENPADPDPSKAVFHLFAEGLQEGLGLKVLADGVYVMQRGELTRLVDVDGDKVCDRFETVSQGWGLSGNYHEFGFGLPVDADGNFYVSLNVGFASPEWWLGVSRAPYRGWVLKISPDGQVTPLACGVRSPAGLGIDDQQRLFYTDNQGDWMPVCGLFHVQEGDFFGHPASLSWREPYRSRGDVVSNTEVPSDKRSAPALWIPYEWSRSTGNVESAPALPGFEPYTGDLFLAELTNGMVLRAMLEEVEGHVQGAVLPWRQEVGSVFRIAFHPSGVLMAGMTNRGWGGLNPGSGIARVRPTGKNPLEYHRVHLLRDGFELKFTAPVPAGADPVAHVYDYDYNWWWDYGSPMMRQKDLDVAGITWNADRTGLTVKLAAPIEAGRNVRVRLDGIGLLHPEFDYTVHTLPGSPEVVYVAKEVEPPALKQNPDEGWLTLTWRDPFDAWTSKGWELVNAELPDKGAEAFTITPGNSALVNTGFPASGFVSKAEFGDIEFRFRFMMPKGGDSGLYFMGRYELQLNDDPWGCLGVIHGKNPRAKGYRGPGEWHEVSGKFFAPRFDADGKKIVNARFDQIQADGVMVIGSCEVGEITAGGVGKDEVAEGPLFFQGSAGRVAIGDVRVRRIVEGEEAHDGGGWTAWDGASRSQGGSFELRGDLNLSDQGGSVLWLAENGGEGLRLVLDHTSSAEARTGSLRGAEFQEGDGLIRTQLLQPEIDFDLLVRVTRGADSAHVEVFLNGLRMQSLHTTAPLAPGNLRLESERIPGTVLKVQNLEIRSR